MTKATLQKAYRKVRATGRFKAQWALKEARRRIALVNLARAEYVAANPKTGDPTAPGALPIDSAEGHAKRHAYVDALAHAGAYAMADSYAPERPQWSEDKTSLYAGSNPPFRDVVAAHDVPWPGAIRGTVIEHDGWYDNFEGESSRDGFGLVWGVVVSLSHGRYLAGWQHGGCDGGPTIATGRGFFDCPVDAARYADGLAERVAENEREYRRAWEAGQRWAELGEEIAETRSRTLAILRENRKTGGSRDLPAIHGVITESVCNAWRRICEARSERAQLALDFDHCDGWAEGAGL